jgi:mannose-6-phosphate isomerase-like protein (cupin superfamily)
MKGRFRMGNPGKSMAQLIVAIALGVAGAAAYVQAATAPKTLFHEGNVRGPIRPVDLESPAGHAVYSEIVAGPNSGLDSAFVVYTRMPAGTHGPAMYTLPADHTYMVLSGKMNVQIGTDKFVAEPETLVLIPAGIPSEVWNAGSEPVSVVEVVTPAPFNSLAAAMKPASPREVENAKQYVRTVKPNAGRGDGTATQTFITRATDPDLVSHIQERIDTAQPGHGVGPGLHVHPFDQVYFELEGSMTLNYGLGTYTVPPNALVVIPVGVVHYNKNNGSSPEKHIVLLLPEPTGEPFDLPVEFKPAQPPPGR